LLKPVQAGGAHHRGEQQDRQFRPVIGVAAAAQDVVAVSVEHGTQRPLHLWRQRQAEGLALGRDPPGKRAPQLLGSHIGDGIHRHVLLPGTARHPLRRA
jgi:hypothetical protein